METLAADGKDIEYFNVLSITYFLCAIKTDVICLGMNAY